MEGLEVGRVVMVGWLDGGLDGGLDVAHRQAGRC